MEAVDEGLNGYLCEKKSTDSLYCMLKRFIELPYSQKNLMGIAGRKRMKEIFDKKLVVDRTLQKLAL